MRAAAFLFLMTITVSAQVQNAADAAANISSSSSVAPGSLGFIADSSNPAATVDGAAVSIRPVGSSTLIPAQITGASDNGITFIVPPDTPLGNVQVVYHQAGELTQWTTATIVPSDFALYPTPATMESLNLLGPATLNGLTTPAQPGQVIRIFGTGIGAIPPNPAQVTLGGVAQTVLYSGNATDQPGMNQINFQIAPGTPDGCYLPLLVTWGAGAATSYLSKTSDGSPCQHPFGLSTADLSTLDSGGSIEVGSISMTTALNAADANHASRQAAANIGFTELNAADIANYFVTAPPQGCAAAVPLSPTEEFVGALASPFEGPMTLQNGATKLNLQSPEYSVTIAPSGDAALNSLPAPAIDAGTWTWSSSGTRSVPGLSFNFNLAAPVQLNGGAPIVIRTSQDQTITWNGSAYDSSAALQLTLGGWVLPSIYCYAPAQAGSITIPAAMLEQFAPGGTGELSVSVTESGGGIPHATFPAPNVLMLVLWGSTDTRPVDFK